MSCTKTKHHFYQQVIKNLDTELGRISITLFSIQVPCNSLIKRYKITLSNSFRDKCLLKILMLVKKLASKWALRHHSDKCFRLHSCAILGQHSTMVSLPASKPSCPKFDSTHSPIFSREKIVDVADVNQLRYIEEVNSDLKMLINLIYYWQPSSLKKNKAVRWQHLSQMKDRLLQKVELFFLIKMQQVISETSAATYRMK